MSVTIQLNKPITAHGETIDSLELRQPTSEDIMQLGTPTLLIPSADGESVGVEIRAKVIGMFIMRLGAIPMNSVKQLSVTDFQRCTKGVMSFFNDGDSET